MGTDPRSLGQMRADEKAFRKGSAAAPEGSQAGRPARLGVRMGEPAPGYHGQHGTTVAG